MKNVRASLVRVFQRIGLWTRPGNLVAERKGADLLIVVIATQGYFALGIRFIKRFHKYYRGKLKVQFHFFSELDPLLCVKYDFPVIFHKARHCNWREATNSKFKAMLQVLSEHSAKYIFYFDADTNVRKDFSEDWMLGDIVGGEHSRNRKALKRNKPYDAYPRSACYVPEDTHLPQMYYLGCFFGGKSEYMKGVLKKLLEAQKKNSLMRHEPVWNDESYLNHFFHYNPPSKVIMFEDFEFVISDKGGLKGLRDFSRNRDGNLVVQLHLRAQLQRARNNVINIKDGAVTIDD